MPQHTFNTIVLLLTLTIGLSGCVRRRLTVRTNPPGAMVYVDRQLIGPSPASTSFTYYGTRHIEVVGDGYRTEKILRTINPPWYQIPPFDLIAETLWPWELRDQRVIDVTMVQEGATATEDVIARADDLRTQAAAGIAVPISRTQGPADVPQTQVVPPTTGFPLPAQPIQPGDINNPVLPPPAVTPPAQPGQFLRDLITPGARIPEGNLQGGGYRPITP